MTSFIWIHKLITPAVGTVCLLPEFPLLPPLFALICIEQNKYINEKELRLTNHRFTAKGRLDMYNKKTLHILSQLYSMCRDYLPGPGFKCGRWMQATSSHEQRCCFRKKGVFSSGKEIYLSAGTGNSNLICISQSSSTHLPFSALTLPASQSCAIQIGTK